MRDFSFLIRFFIPLFHLISQYMWACACACRNFICWRGGSKPRKLQHGQFVRLLNRIAFSYSEMSEYDGKRAVRFPLSDFRGQHILQTLKPVLGQALRGAICNSALCRLTVAEKNDQGVVVIVDQM